MKNLFFAFVLFFTAAHAEARLPLDGPAFWTMVLEGTDAGNPYQVGSEWSKRPVTNADLEKATPQFRRAALATARAGGGTSFYLGKFNGKQVMATNHHVYEEASNCLGRNVRFPLLGIQARCVEFFGSWPEIDLALFVVSVSASDEAKLAPAAGNFAFRKDILQGEDLVTVGFGTAENPMRALVASQDSDCKVFSPTREYRLMGDPDSFNPAPYKAWSFANGCDVSHGDSGSAMVNRQTSEVVGIIWTGKIPKISQIQDSNYLREMLNSGSEEIWTELSYAVPAVKIGEVLDAMVKDEMSLLTPDARVTISEMLR